MFRLSNVLRCCPFLRGLAVIFLFVAILSNVSLTGCLRVSYLEKLTNEEIMSRSRMPQLSTMIMLKRIKWYGHIQRMEPGRLARSAFDWDPPDQYVHARRAPGVQRKTWMSQIEGDCVRNKVSFTRLQEKAATGSKNAFNNFVVQHFTE